MAWAKESVMTNDLYSDDRYPEGIHWGDLNVTSVLCVPVLTRDKECSVVIELYRNNGVDYIEVTVLRFVLLDIPLLTIVSYSYIARLGHCDISRRMDGLSN